MAAYYKMETIEHFAKISLVARLLGREHLISREEVDRLQNLRGFYGIPAPAPLCTDPATDMTDQATCQILEAPESSRSAGSRRHRRPAASEQGWGNSANIRRTHGAHR
jgi:hypothetical protein